jgi:hypothetical protein
MHEASPEVASHGTAATADRRGPSSFADAGAHGRQSASESVKFLMEDVQLHLPSS